MFPRMSPAIKMIKSLIIVKTINAEVEMYNMEITCLEKSAFFFIKARYETSNTIGMCITQKKYCVVIFLTFITIPNTFGLIKVICKANIAILNNSSLPGLG